MYVRLTHSSVAGSSNRAKTDFLRAFMVQNGSTLNGDTGLKTPFSVLIHKLQDLLSRTEHFEVITVHHSSYESRNTASMLSKQLRLRLIAEDESDIPKPYKNIMVSIHAIANFKTLDEYLRPRIAISERSRASRHRDAAFLSQFEGASRPTDTPGENKEPKTTSERKPMPSHQPSSSKTSGNTRAAKSSEKSKIANNTSQPTTPGGSQDRSGRSRRSTRRQPAPPPPPPDDESEESDEPLECADERQLSDDDEGEEEEEDEGALDAIVDDLDEDLSENGGPDPTAVNMEVASSGKVTARRDDGTKVATPAQSTPSRDSATASASASAAQSLRNSLALAGRPFASYAAAMTSLPQDWHIEFSIDDKSISHDTTIYRAIHHNRNPVPDNITGSVWSTIHTIRFKRVQGPPPAEPSKLSPSAPSESSDLETEDLPESLTKATTTSSILKLLRVLHRLNSQLDYILAEVKEPIKVSTEAPAQFINTKLTAKLNRQLEEPLIVASSCLPNWSEDLARHFPFLFPFETRHLFLQSTSFGYARSMTRWQGSHSGDDSRRDQRRDDRPFTRLQRQKVRISRTRILESALKVMELYGSSSSVLEVEYFEEVGTGLGPTLEFYSTVSKEFARKKLKLWRDHDSNDGDYVYSKLGLFPAPMSPEQLTQDSGKRVLAYFRGLGKFVARSMLDSRIIDVAFNPTFFRIANNITTFTPSIGAIKAVDPGLASSLMMLKQFANEMVAISANTALTDEAKSIAIRTCQVRGVTIGELGLDFTLPGYPNVELLLDGAETPLTMANVDAYVSKVIDMTLGTGIRRQIEAFRSGFSEVFSYSALRAFTPNELVMLFGQVEEDWSIESMPVPLSFCNVITEANYINLALMDSIKADHGFNLDSRSVRNLLETMSKFTLQQRRDFLQFVTGSPKLPIGGKFKTALWSLDLLRPFFVTEPNVCSYRIQESHANVYRRVPPQRPAIYVRRLSTERDDLR